MSFPGRHCFVEVVVMQDNNLATLALLPSGYCGGLYIQCVHSLPRTSKPLHASIKSLHHQNPLHNSNPRTVFFWLLLQ